MPSYYEVRHHLRAGHGEFGFLPTCVLISPCLTLYSPKNSWVLMCKLRGLVWSHKRWDGKPVSSSSAGVRKADNKPAIGLLFGMYNYSRSLTQWHIGKRWEWQGMIGFFISHPSLPPCRDRRQYVKLARNAPQRIKVGYIGIGVTH